MLLSNSLHFEAGSSRQKETFLFVFKRLGFLLFLSGMWLCVKLLPLLTGDKLTLTNLDNEQRSKRAMMIFFFTWFLSQLTGISAAAS